LDRAKRAVTLKTAFHSTCRVAREDQRAPQVHRDQQARRDHRDRRARQVRQV